MTPALFTSTSTPPERRVRRIEHPAHGLGIADIGLGRQRAAARTLDPSGQRLSGRRVAGGVDDDREPVARQPFRDGCANAARGPRNNRYFFGFV